MLHVVLEGCKIFLDAVVSVIILEQRNIVLYRLRNISFYFRNIVLDTVLNSDEIVLDPGDRNHTGVK